MVQDHLKQMVLLLMCHQKANNSLILCHKACVTHLTASHRAGFASSPISTGRRVHAVQQGILREREEAHSHNFYYDILLESVCFIIVVVILFLCLIYQLNFIISMYV